MLWETFERLKNHLAHNFRPGFSPGCYLRETECIADVFALTESYRATGQRAKVQGEHKRNLSA